MCQTGIDPFEAVNVAAHPGLLTTFATRVDEWILERQTASDRVEISGRSTSPDTGELLVGARLRIAGTALDAIVGPGGFFRLGPLPRDNFRPLADAPSAGLSALGKIGTIPVSASFAPGLHLPTRATTRGVIPGTFGARLEGTPPRPLPVRPLRAKLWRSPDGCTTDRSGCVLSPSPTQATVPKTLPWGSYRIVATVPSEYRRIKIE